jgi:hypothetical protein
MMGPDFRQDATSGDYPRFEKLQGHVEADETYVGGHQTMKERYAKGTNKVVVMDMKERGGRTNHVETGGCSRIRSSRRTFMYRRNT